MGLVEEADGALSNPAFLTDRRGGVAGKARKQPLCHFYAAWFTPGRGMQGFEVDTRDESALPVGILVCADARLPEVARVLVRPGALVLLDPANRVSAGWNVTQLTYPQAEFMIACRALENQVCLARDNQVGLEQGSILCCGRSLLVGPHGVVLALASTTDLGPFGPQTSLDGGLHPWRDRRSELYSPLAAPQLPLDREEGGPYLVACT